MPSTCSSDGESEYKYESDDPDASESADSDPDDAQLDLPSPVHKRTRTSSVRPRKRRRTSSESGQRGDQNELDAVTLAFSFRPAPDCEDVLPVQKGEKKGAPPVGNSHGLTPVDFYRETAVFPLATQLETAFAQILAFCALLPWRDKSRYKTVAALASAMQKRLVKLLCAYCLYAGKRHVIQGKRIFEHVLHAIEQFDYACTCGSRFVSAGRREAHIKKALLHTSAEDPVVHAAITLTKDDSRPRIETASRLRRGAGRTAALLAVTRRHIRQACDLAGADLEQLLIDSDDGVPMFGAAEVSADTGDEHDEAMVDQSADDDAAASNDEEDEDALASDHDGVDEALLPYRLVFPERVPGDADTVGLVDSVPFDISGPTSVENGHARAEVLSGAGAVPDDLSRSSHSRHSSGLAVDPLRVSWLGGLLATCAPSPTAEAGLLAGWRTGSDRTQIDDDALSFLVDDIARIRPFVVEGAPRAGPGV